MRFNFSESKIYVRPGATDLRKGVSGLCSIIGNEMNLDAEGCKRKRIIERSIATPSLLAHVFTGAAQKPAGHVQLAAESL